LKIFSLITVIISGFLLMSATSDFPPIGDPHSPANTHNSPHYIESTMEETSVPNIVTAVLGDYRGFDTMFETVVVFAATLGCFLLLRTYRHKTKERYYRHCPTGVVIHIKGEKDLPETSTHFERIDSDWVPPDIITRSVIRLLVPFIQLFALYVIAHGHHSPGGGFQGGVILGASFILLAISYDLRFVLKRVKEKTMSLFCLAGVVIFSGVGLICMGLGFNFLDYSALSKILPVSQVAARSWGILFVEIGVGITVMAAMVIIYNNVASEGRYDEGL
jgi:multicomponent Na+:H+ antiporter subunit B